MFDGVASPLTQTFGLGLSGAVDAADLTRLERFFQDRGAPVFHEVSPMADATLIALFHARGYQPFEFTNILYRPIDRDVRIAAAKNADLHVRTVATDDHAAWAETAAGGWSETPELAAFIAAFAPVILGSRGVVCSLAELHGRPIATAAMSLSGGVALLAGASTVPEGRRNGAQLALLDDPPAARGAARLRSGDDGRAPGQRVAAQRRAAGVPHRLHAHQVAVARAERDILVTFQQLLAALPWKAIPNCPGAICLAAVGSHAGAVDWRRCVHSASVACRPPAIWSSWRRSSTAGIISYRRPTGELPAHAEYAGRFRSQAATARSARSI